MKIKLRKHSKNKTFYVIFSIIIGTIIFINTLGKKVSNNLVNYSQIQIRNIITESINESININSINKYNINDLIIISYTGEDITSVDYNIEKSYSFLNEVKRNLIEIINTKYNINNNNIIITIPFYNYTNNIFLMNLGPKVSIKLDIFNIIDSNISTNISYYGINTIKLEIYINFNITSNIIVPFNKEDITNTYNILISSKIINGKIPTYYGNTYRSESDNFNI